MHNCTAIRLTYVEDEEGRGQEQVEQEHQPEHVELLQPGVLRRQIEQHRVKKWQLQTNENNGRKCSDNELWNRSICHNTLEGP